MTAPQEIIADSFKHLLDNQKEVWNEMANGPVWVVARPFSCYSRWNIFNRLYLAFRVFMGWSDAVKFHEQP